MITKSYIEELKSRDLGGLYKLINETKGNKEILFIFENLGHLPKDFDISIFTQYTKNSNSSIRFWAVKNIGKQSNPYFLDLLTTIATQDSDSLTRREAVSSIGRMRNRQAIPHLITLLHDDDPKVILQAIRGLLIFKDEKMVVEELKKLRDHPNEMIQAVITKEFQKTTRNSDILPHLISPDYLKNVVVNGDVREVLNNVPDETIHLTFTSPPYYNARDYSIYESYQSYLDFLTEVFKEVYRITKEGRFFVLNTSPIIIPRMSRAHSSIRYPIPFDIHCRLTELGWEFIDDIVWLKPETSVKNRNAGFLQHRKPLGYKPNAVTEYLMVYRKKTTKLLDWNIHQYPLDVVEKSKVRGEYETTNVWKIDPTFDSVHSAVFPIELCNRVVSYYSYVGDLVFDPFGGSGTVGKSCTGLRRYFFMTELEEKYFSRMQETLGKKSLFDTIFPSPRFFTADEFSNIERQD